MYYNKEKTNFGALHLGMNQHTTILEEVPD